MKEVGKNCVFQTIAELKETTANKNVIEVNGDSNLIPIDVSKPVVGSC